MVTENNKSTGVEFCIEEGFGKVAEGGLSKARIVQSCKFLCTMHGETVV